MIPQHGTLELSAARLRHNVALLRAKLPATTRIGALIKADAYGHGAGDMTTLLHRSGIAWCCAYNIAEAVAAARLAGESGVALKVLALAPLVALRHIMSTGATALLEDALHYHIRLTLVDAPSATALNNTLANGANSETVRIHVQIDTGLTRSGVAPDAATELIRHILTLPHLRLEGLYTHLSHGDEPDHPSIAAQIRTLHQIADPIKLDHPHILVHAQNSGGTWNFSDAGLDMVRIGIALYGLQPSVADPIPGLQPIARLVAPILMIHERRAGVGVGYGHTFTTQRSSRLAIVPVGYADGYPRALSNRGIVQIRGQNAPVVGRVSMDQIIIDVTDIPAAAPGDEAIVFSNDPAAPNGIDQVAQACGTIGYEIATGLGSRLARRVVD